jgi:hypothetical protein
VGEDAGTPISPPRSPGRRSESWSGRCPSFSSGRKGKSISQSQSTLSQLHFHFHRNCLGQKMSALDQLKNQQAELQGKCSSRLFWNANPDPLPAGKDADKDVVPGAEQGEGIPLPRFDAHCCHRMGGTCNRLCFELPHQRHGIILATKLPMHLIS